jgi:hypothetical protein
MNSIPAIPDELKDALMKDRCSIFIGAGLSVAAGYPTWEQLLTTLITKAHTRGYIDDNKRDEFLQMAKTTSKWLMVAQELSDIYTQPGFQTEIALIINSVPTTPTESHKLITQIPFKFALTTNYDKLIENAYFPKFNSIPTIFTYADVADFADSLWKQDFFILKAHGTVDRLSTIILTEKDYRTVIYSSPGYRAILAAVFTTKTILFVGFSLSDPEIQLLLSSLHNAFQGSGVYHYALVPKPEFSATEAAHWRKNYNVECIVYEPSTGHPEVEEFLKNLRDAVSPTP